MRLAVLIFVLLILISALVAQDGLNVDIKADSFVPKTIVAENATQLIFHNTLTSKVNVRCNGTESVKFDIENGKSVNKTLKAGEYKCEIMVADKTVNAGTITITCAPSKDGKKVPAKVSFKDIDTSASGFRLGDWFEFTNVSDQPLSIKSVEGLFDTGELAPGQVSSIRPTRA
ncbi:MAG TPA: hypothetical protein VHQ01_09190, partial [Pyrinomonadaceae bacterium]|nr:hypothetical protein [Pyrinomonadaceae bacterium]